VDPLIGKTFSKVYKAQRLLGSGAFGKVYLVDHPADKQLFIFHFFVHFIFCQNPSLFDFKKIKLIEGNEINGQRRSSRKRIRGHNESQ